MADHKRIGSAVLSDAAIDATARIIARHAPEQSWLGITWGGVSPKHRAIAREVVAAIYEATAVADCLPEPTSPPTREDLYGDG